MNATETFNSYKPEAEVGRVSLNSSQSSMTNKKFNDCDQPKNPKRFNNFKSRQNNYEDNKKKNKKRGVDLYFSNLPLTYNEDHMYNLLNKYGKVLYTHILRDKNLKSRGAGFAGMESMEICQNVIKGERNNLLENGNRRLNVDIARKSSQFATKNLQDNQNTYNYEEQKIELVVKVDNDNSGIYEERQWTPYANYLPCYKTPAMMEQQYQVYPCGQMLQFRRVPSHVSYNGQVQYNSQSVQNTPAPVMGYAYPSYNNTQSQYMTQMMAVQYVNNGTSTHVPICCTPTANMQLNGQGVSPVLRDQYTPLQQYNTYNVPSMQQQVQETTYIYDTQQPQDPNASIQIYNSASLSPQCQEQTYINEQQVLQDQNSYVHQQNPYLQQ